MKKSLIEAIINMGTAGGATSMAETASTMMRLAPNGPMVKMMEIVIGGLNPIAMALVAIYFIASMIETYFNNRGEVTLEAITKNAVGLVIADVLINNDVKIIEAVASIFNMLSMQFTAGIKELVDDPNFGSGITESTLNGETLVSLLFLFIASLLGFLVLKIATIIIGVNVLATKLEFVIRLCFSPVALSGFASDNYRTKSMNYLRKMVASAFYCMAVILAIYLGSSAAADTAANLAEAGKAAADAGIGGTGVYSTVVNYLMVILQGVMGPFAGIGVVSAAKGIVNEAFGT
jgi:hypothetical protein